jgi:Mitochondrial biogenesis AIM24
MVYGGLPPPPQYSMPPGGPPAPPPQTFGGGFTVQDTVGTFEGLGYRIDHRDSNSILHLTLLPGYEVKAKPGAMVTMQPTVQIRGNLKFSWKKMVTGGEMSESWYTGPGDVVLAPDIWGDIVPVRVSLSQYRRSSRVSPLTGISRASD